MGVRVFFGVVNELVFVVVEVVLCVGVRQTKLKNVPQSLGFAVEVKEVHLMAIPDPKHIFFA